MTETEFDIRFNPDVYSDGVKHAESPSELKKQKQLVKDAADFVISVQIPSFVSIASDELSPKTLLIISS